MTQWNQNGITPNPNGNNPNRSSKTPEEIEGEIARTRGAISSDINELGDKFSPDKLRESAKGVISDAKEEARDLMREAKEAAVGSLREAKDSAVGSLRDVKDSAVESFRSAKDTAFHAVSDTAQQIGTQAKRAGGATAQFVGENAIPLSLISVGVAWLTLSLRQNRSSRGYGDSRYSFDAELDREWEQNLDRDLGSASSSQGSRGLRDRIRPRVEDLQHRMDEVGQKARDMGRDARDRLVGVEHDARDFALDNPLAIGAVAIAAGVGVGLLLPGTSRENQLMGETRARLMNDARRTAGRVAQTAKDTVNEVKTAIKEPS